MNKIYLNLLTKRKGHGKKNWKIRPVDTENQQIKAHKNGKTPRSDVINAEKHGT